MNQVIEQMKALTAGVLTAVFAMSIVTLGVLSWTDSIAGVANTKHNLGTGGNAGQNQFGQNTGGTGSTAAVCVFCHTPHGGDTSATSPAPLWNKANARAYQTYEDISSATIEGGFVPVGSVSIGCLSCHDGAQAMNTLLNDPGSGNTNTDFQGGVWTGPNVQTNGQLAVGAASNLTQDLRNDHPIGIQYGGGGLSDANTTGATADPEFRLASTTTVNNGDNVWWVNVTGGTAAREKTDMILYNRPDVLGVTGNQPFVECATCHDPHSETTLFLRTSNDNSAVCLACHDK